MLKRLFATNNRPYVPGWHRTREVRYNLSGIEFSMQVPYSTAPDGANRYPYGVMNIFDPDLYPKYAKDALPHTISDLLWRPLFGELWESKGSLVNGRSAGMFFDVAVVSVTGLPATMSCWNPKHFQQVMDRRMYYSHYGPIDGGMGYEVTMPVNWRVEKINGVDWLHYGISPAYPLEREDFDEWVKTYKTPWYYLTPLSDRHVLSISLAISSYHEKEPGFQYCAALMDQVVRSTRLENLPHQVDLSPLNRPRAPLHWKPFKIEDVCEDPDPLKWHSRVAVAGSPPPPYCP